MEHHIDTQEQFEIDKILDSKAVRGNITYLVKWKGYPISEASCIKATDVHADRLINFIVRIRINQVPYSNCMITYILFIFYCRKLHGRGGRMSQPPQLVGMTMES
uniref:Chromo domain-containing protein n=1 Tax=Micrurus surinamensis TaxID=129470 RepID=A0A2D4PU74_MICSU